MSGWTQEELAAAVAAYRWMEQRVAQGHGINKAQVYRELSERHGRSLKSWEYRMQNISYVLQQLGQPRLDGLRPAANVGPAITGVLTRLLQTTGELARLSPLSDATQKELEEEERLAEAAHAFSPSNAEDQRRRVVASIVRRRGQPAFRKALLAAYDSRCALTGCGLVEVLEAAHVYPYKNEATNSVTNGLLLRADVHTLFDLRLIAVDPGSLRVMTAPLLRDSDYAALNGSLLATPVRAEQAVSRDSLEWHLSRCEWR